VLPLILAHGPVLGLIAFGLGVVAFASLVVAVAVWWLSLPPKLSSPNGCVPPMLVGLATILISWGAAALWYVTDWTVAGPVKLEPPGWRLLCLLVLPSPIAGAVYVWRRRSNRRKPDCDQA